jgi:uncharacterized protein DUF5063
MMDQVNNELASRNVLEFVTIANEYCALVENIFDTEKGVFVDKSVKILPFMYLKGMLLPDLEMISEDLVPKFVTEEEWETINNDVANLLGDDNVYKEVFDPLVDLEEPREMTLSENFADLYQDIKDFLSLYHQGSLEDMNDAIFECKQTFKQYWGQRTVNALRVLHNLNFSQ